MIQPNQNLYLNIIITCILWLFQENKLIAQNVKPLSKWAGIFEIGFAISEGEGTYGTSGLLQKTGVQRSFGKKDKLCLLSQFSMASLSNKATTDVRDAHYTHYQLSIATRYDILRFKAFSLFLKAGVFGLNSSGLLGSNAYQQSTPQRQTFFSEWHAGANAGLGIKIQPKNKHLGFLISPIDFGFGKNRFYFEHATLGLIFRINKKEKT